MKIGDRVFVSGYIDEIRKDTVIVRNDGGYFGTVPSEVITGELPSAQPEKRTKKRMETHACDLIDREAAADAIYHHLPSVSRTRARTMLHEVPPAQPEPCEDLCENAANKTSAHYYSGRLKNDEHRAVEVLDQFTKEFCIDAEAGDDLIFRCSECVFEVDNGICLVKSFARKFAPNYKDFGSMGDL